MWFVENKVNIKNESMKHEPKEEKRSLKTQISTTGSAKKHVVKKYRERRRWTNKRELGIREIVWKRVWMV